MSFILPPIRAYRLQTRYKGAFSYLGPNSNIKRPMSCQTHAALHWASVLRSVTGSNPKQPQQAAPSVGRGSLLYFCSVSCLSCKRGHNAQASLKCRAAGEGVHDQNGLWLTWWSCMIDSPEKNLTHSSGFPYSELCEVAIAGLERRVYRLPLGRWGPRLVIHLSVYICT